MAAGEERNEAGLKKAAMLMLSLDRPVLARVLKHLKSEEVTQVMQHYDRQTAGEHPSQEQLLTAGIEFVEQWGAQSPSSHFKEALTLAFGNKAAEEMFRHDHWREIADRIEPQGLAAILRGERPQAVAVILSQLPPRFSAEVLSQLPEELRAEAVDRICRNERVAGQALDALLRAIEEHLTTTRGSADTREQGNGIQRAAAVLNQLESESATVIVDRIRAADPDRAAAIEQEMFHFNDLLRLESRDLQRVLAETKPERLALALKGIPDEMRQGVFSAVPEAVAKVVKEEIDTAGRVPMREVQSARRELTNLALQLDREGKIHIRSDEQMVA